ncbi:MAG: hypothetical protein HN608_03720, partial [Rhodospirillaceae bacterium]|nr:hypothetical protein [Rhodospirillaceae bacterium]
AGAIGAFAVFGFLNPDSSTAQSVLSKSDEVKPVKTATLVRETKPAAFTQPAPDIAPARPTPDPIPKINTELRIPRLNILERHAPAGRSCIDVSFGKTQAELRAVPLDQSNHLKTSSGPALCGLVLRIELGPDETYTLANLEVMAGSLVGNLRPPPGLSGRRPVAGRHDWIVDLPHRTRDAVRYRLSLTTSKSIIRGSTPSGDSNTISVLHKILPKIPG